MRTQVNQHDQFFTCLRLRFESEDDAAIVLHPTRPQPLQLPAQFVRLERRQKWVTGQLIQNIENAFLQNAISSRLLLESRRKLLSHDSFLTNPSPA